MADTSPPDSDSLSAEMGESAVGVPTRRVPVAPVPLAVRQESEHGPLRRWSPLATLDSPVIAEVDPAGRVRLAGMRWSFDWWIGAEDRWHHPSMEGGVTSGAHDGSPVRETRMRVPGGGITQRVGAAVAGAGGFNGAAVVVEVENDSAVPVALALVVTPWELDRPGTVGEVALGALDGDGGVVLVDGEPAVLLDRSPARVVAGSTQDVAKSLAAASDEVPVAGQLFEAGPSGDLEVALVVPLAHGATARVLLVPTRTVPRDRGRRARRARGLAQVTTPFSAPLLDTVAAGWAAHSATDPRIVPPYDSWAELVAFSGPQLRVAGPAEVTRALDPGAPQPAGPGSGARLASVCEALAGLDANDVNNAIAGALVGAQRFSGSVEPADRSDATAALCWSAGAVLLGEKGAVLADDFVGPVAKAVRWLSKQHRKGLDAGIGGVGAWRCSAALRFVASGLAAVGQPEVAQDALELADALDVARDPEVAEGLESDALEPEGLEGERSPGSAGAVTAEWAAGHSTFGDACAERDAGRHGSTRGLERLAERISQRRDTAIADAVGAPSVLGCDAAELAETRLALLDALVRDGPRGPQILPVWPSAWRGNPVEAHGIRTAWGTVSFGLRWHGERAALLWEVVPALGSSEPSTAPVVRAPGLDPGFAATTWSGEGLLEADGPAPREASSAGPGGAGVRSEGGGDAGGSIGEGESFT